MKHIIFIVMLLFTTSVFAQQGTNEDKQQTLFGSGTFKSGGYGCPEVKFTPISGVFDILVGGRGGWIAKSENYAFSIGGGGYGLVTSHEMKNFYPNSDTAVYLRMGYGGLFLNYTNSPNSLVHFTLNTLIGAGGVSYTHSFKNMINRENDFMHGSQIEMAPFFVVEPGAGIELNLTNFCRIELGLSYRLVSGLEMSKTTNSDLSGLSGNLAFKFGSF